MTYEELVAAGAKPNEDAAPKGLTYEQLVAAGAQPADAPPKLPAGRAAPRQRYAMPAPPEDAVELQPVERDPLRSRVTSMQQSPMYQSAEAKGRRMGRTLDDLATSGTDVADAALLGAPRLIRDAATAAIDPAAVDQIRAREQSFHDIPIVGQLPTAAGYVAPQGAPGVIARGVFAGMGRLTARAPAVAARVLASRPVSGALTGAATGAATTAAENVVADRPIGENVGRAALMGGGLGLAGGAAGAAGNRVQRQLARNPDRQLIERHGGRITPTSPATGGAFDDPLIRQGIDDSGNVTDAGIGRVARQAAGRVRQSLNDEHAASRGVYANDVEKLRASGATEGFHDFTDLAEEAKRMADDVERYTGDTRAKIKAEILPVLEKYESEGSYMGSAEDVNRLRKKIQKVANFQTPTGVVKDKDIGRLARMAKDVVDETAYAEPNAGYAQRSDKLRAAHRALNIPGKSRTHTDPNDVAAEKTLTDVITRRGQNTVTAGKYDTPELDTAIAERPDLALPLDSAALLRARSRMQLTGRDKAGGLIERTNEGKLHAGRYIDELRDFLVKNATVIGQRFVYPAASAASRLAPPPATLNLPQALRRVRQQEETIP